MSKCGGYYCAGCGAPRELATGATRKGVDEALRTMLIFDGGNAVMFAKGTTPANGLQAARETLSHYRGATAIKFSHLKNGYPVYRND